MNHRHDKEKVIAKGMELFWNEGFHSLGVDKICRETGMTKGAFYNAFKSKEQFLLTTLKAYGDLIEAHLKTQLSNNTASAFDKLVALYKEMLESQLQNGFKGCFVNNMMSEMATLNMNVSKLSDEQFNRFIKVIEPTVQQAQNDGDFEDNLSAKQLAEIIHTMFFGFLTRAKSLKLSTHEPMVLFLHALKSK